MTSKRTKVEPQVKKHLDAIMEIDGGWQCMLDLLQVRAIQKMLREGRIVQGKTQAEVAEALGVERARVAQLETVRYPDYRIATIAGWARVLDMEVQMGVIQIVTEEGLADE